MKDEDIGNLLRKLPRHKASDGFTGRLLESLPERPPSAPAWRRPALALAAVVVLMVAVSSAWNYRERAKERAEAAERVEALRTEYESLQRELSELRAIAAESQPVLRLEGGGDVDFLMDLRSLPREAEDARVRPANYGR